MNFSDPFGLCPEIPQLCGIIGANRGQAAAEFWADLAVNNSGVSIAGIEISQQQVSGVANVFGVVASAWTPDTWKKTTTTLLVAGAVNKVFKRVGTSAAVQLLLELLTGDFGMREDSKTLDDMLEEHRPPQNPVGDCSGTGGAPKDCGGSTGTGSGSAN